MRQIETDVAIKNLKEMYEEFSEISEDGKMEVDLDLLFLDIVEAIGLNADDHLAKITGEAAARRTMERVNGPEKI